jgi:aspartate/glutamate racemase
MKIRQVGFAPMKTLGLVRRLRAAGAQAIILGCTEFGLLAPPKMRPTFRASIRRN